MKDLVKEAGVNTILISVDVEDWFQVENFKPWIPFSTWSSRKLRVEKNTHLILDLLDSYRCVSAPPNPEGHPIRATFFVLGWLADRLPGLVREIDARGHEVASHGYNHHLCTKQSRKGLLNDLTRSRKRLEDITGAPVTGYRAPSFSISDEILHLIHKSGYRYDSSYNSFGAHGRYGQINLKNRPAQEIIHRISENFYELPVSNLEWRGRTIPLGGGGYFRLYPFYLFKKGVQAVLKKDRAFLLYIHPWELDPDQPRVQKASICYKFRHYIHLSQTKKKLESLIKQFISCHFTTCQDHLNRITQNGR